MWRRIKKIIHDNDNFVLTTHVNPDGDGVGSSCAFTELLLHFHKKVRLICDDPVPKKLSFLDYHGTHEVYDEEEDYSSTQVLIVLDTHEKERIGRVQNLLNNKNLTSICIDHHPSKETFTPHTILDSKACSVGAMVYTLYKECGVELNIRAATGIYTSIICDTGRFSYSSTTRKAHKIAEECIKLGVDPNIMHMRLFQQIPLSHMKIIAQALQHIEMHADNRVAVQVIHLKDYEREESDIQDIEFLHHEFNKAIEGVECVVVLTELKDLSTRVSIRSKTDLDIGKIMRSVGGGGHSKAAGVTWNCNVKEAKKKVVELITQGMS